MKLAITVIYVIFYNSIFELIEVSTQKPRCFTTYDSPSPLKTCIFPFKFRGQTYTGDFNFLATFMNLSYSFYTNTPSRLMFKHLLKSGCPIGNFPNGQRRWCSTRINPRTGIHVSGQNEYGYCNTHCPKHNWYQIILKHKMNSILPTY